MAEHAVGQEEELFSLSMRPFQQVKQSGKTICLKCFEEDGVVNFFSRRSWLGSAFSLSPSGIPSVLLFFSLPRPMAKKRSNESRKRDML